MREINTIKFKFKNSLGVLILLMLLCLPFKLNAQDNKVDSLLVMLKEVKPNNQLDSLKFQKAGDFLFSNKWNDAEIQTIEKNIESGFSSDDRELGFLLKSAIFYSLIKNDQERAILYGKNKLIELKGSKTPNARLFRDNFLSALRLPYRNTTNLEKGFEYFNARLMEFRTTKDSSGLATVHYVLSGFYSTTGLTDEAIYHLKKSISYTNEDPAYDNAAWGLGKANGIGRRITNTSVLGQLYYDKGDLDGALEYSSKALEEAKEGGEKNLFRLPYLSTNIIRIKLAQNELEEVSGLLKPIKKPLTSDEIEIAAMLMQLETEYHIKTGNLELAESFYNATWKIVKENNIPVSSSVGIIIPDFCLAMVRIAQNRLKEAIILLDKNIERLGNLRVEKLKNYRLQASLYKEIGDYQKAYLINEKYWDLQEEMQKDIDKYRRVSFEVEQDINRKELSINTLQAENEISSIVQKFSMGLAFMFILLTSTIYYRFRSKKKAHTILETTLLNLKSTQSQLIQSEKMASLGELTAGIAHEIQNPLNFVNNFSELNSELIVELKEELANGNIEGVKAIAGNLFDNEAKITHHGKRADAIVKGMLAHSRNSSGEKIPTDINALADEFLRLSYHGLRAKNQFFNADFQTDFDHNLPKINVVPQDIGRVLLNLINNAFQAVNGVENPKVTVATKQWDNVIQITVSDNGPGISDDIKDKIFQPFFTTKPAGQGTGLGLSLSYDIVKAHGGELITTTNNIENLSGEGVGTTFLIVLPI